MHEARSWYCSRALLTSSKAIAGECTELTMVNGGLLVGIREVEVRGTRTLDSEEEGPSRKANGRERRTSWWLVLDLFAHRDGKGKCRRHAGVGKGDRTVGRHR